MLLLSQIIFEILRLPISFFNNYLFSNLCLYSLMSSSLDWILIFDCHSLLQILLTLWLFFLDKVKILFSCKLLRCLCPSLLYFFE
jgi:hypothetical protein